jgi:succinyl-CoA synthetase beta subunit
VDLFEAEAKRLLTGYGIRVPSHDLVRAGTLVPSFQGPRMLKAQILAGDRARYGLVREVRDHEDAAHSMATMTEAKGGPVEWFLLEEKLPVAAEFYCGFYVDRTQREPFLMVSPEGGTGIEAKTVHRIALSPLTGLRDFHVRQAARALSLDGRPFGGFAKVLHQLFRMFVECDCLLLEINPLAVTADGEFVALDAKMSTHAPSSGMATFQRLESASETHAREARDLGIHIVSGSGAIVIITGGAGQLMTMMDLVSARGGTVAGAMDIAALPLNDEGALQQALELTLRVTRPDVILANFYVRVWDGDMIGRAFAGVAQAHPESTVIVRLKGSRAEEGIRIVEQAGVAHHASLLEACEAAVACARKA